VAALNEELSRLRSMYETQQTVYHESVSAATEQVGSREAGVFDYAHLCPTRGNSKLCG
jgi:hypothetical protein